MPACGREPLTDTKNMIRHIDACEKHYRNPPFLPREFSAWHKRQRPIDAWCSSVVPCSRAWGCFMPSSSCSHLGRCHSAAQFSAALAALQPLGRAVQGLETTLPCFPYPLSPLPVKVRQSPLLSSSVAHSSNLWREAVCRFCREGEYLVEPAAFLWFGSGTLW